MQVLAAVKPAHWQARLRLKVVHVIPNSPRALPNFESRIPGTPENTLLYGEQASRLFAQAGCLRPML